MTITADRRYQISRVMNAARWNRGAAADPLQRTPDALFRQLDREFAFTLDAAASDRNAKCARYFTVADDALGRDWGTERVWLNPPFGRGLDNWLRKAWEASRGGALVVALVPSATDMGWWHEYAMRADEIRFIRGRVRFDRESGQTGANAFMPISIVVFRATLTGERESLPL